VKGLSVRVTSYMSSPVVTVSENDNLAHVRNLMIKFKIGRVPVVSEESVKGIVTLTDFVKALVSQERKWASLPIDEILVKKVMTPNPILILYTKSIRLAAKTMTRYKISGLPVVDENKKLKGIITKTDIVHAIPRTNSANLLVESVMSRNVITVFPNHTLYRAATLMAQNGISHLVVVEGKAPIGVISKSDLASFAPSANNSAQSFIKFKRPRFATEQPRRVYLVPIVADLMSTDLLIIRPDATLKEAASAMLRKGVSSLPVVDERDNLVGIITKSDLVRSVARFR